MSRWVASCFMRPSVAGSSHWIIDEDHQRMLGPSEYADEVLEHGLEADLGVQRRKCWHVRLRTDHPIELRHQAREQAPA